jgi:hypothetical protein
MSVKELVFKKNEDEMEVGKPNDDCIEITIYCKWSDRCNGFLLDRSQAHLLMLYLQEHLK